MKKKILLALGVAALLASSIPAGFAADFAQAPVAAVSTNSEVNGVEPRADIIEYKYRILGDKRQYRRWNATRGYWVDPEWIDLN